METIRLKNGAEEPKPLVTTTMLSLNALLTNQPTVFYDLVMKCHDPQYSLFGNAGERVCKTISEVR